ncbi:esterase/lipase family protein [Iodobacter arcticus]|uniref:Esterase/lipase family protein n=1 Tax=Iodobacter arcticus TaxID=590593 RepID=A0ABW2R4U8_9NEIS
MPTPQPISQSIPTQQNADGSQHAEGFTTPKDLDTVQSASFLPERVIPVILIPGIMGSNLRIKDEKRLKQLNKSSDIAWRPDRMTWGLGMLFTDAEERQLALDPRTTEVDIYDPRQDKQGKESSEDRHNNVSVTKGSPLLIGDSKKTATQKARERGWGEVMFDSYGGVLNTMEIQLNLAFANAQLSPEGKKIVEGDPANWELDKNYTLTKITEDELKQVMTNCYFPVHAFGYNWLESNGIAGKKLAGRVDKLIEGYKAQGKKCEKVILVTHSMGGLVARAICHPSYGNLSDKVLGIVHGVMPALGAAAAYRRMRAGWESGGLVSLVLGHKGPNVTAVLANAQGGLELAPNNEYGKGWLKFVNKKGKELGSRPKAGDPYAEIYKVSTKEKWWGLLVEDWLNPAKLETSGLELSRRKIIHAQLFHVDIANHYHGISYAHYGNDPKHKAFKEVVWELDTPESYTDDDIDGLEIDSDNNTGTLKLKNKKTGQIIKARILAPQDPGDETVPAFSADDQLNSSSPKFKAIFRQTGYGHQDSYQNPNAVASTIHSIIRIAANMGW